MLVKQSDIVQPSNLKLVLIMDMLDLFIDDFLGYIYRPVEKRWGRGAAFFVTLIAAVSLIAVIIILARLFVFN